MDKNLDKWLRETGYVYFDRTKRAQELSDIVVKNLQEYLNEVEETCASENIVTLNQVKAYLQSTYGLKA